MSHEEKHVFSQINGKKNNYLLYLILTVVKTHWGSGSISNEGDYALQCPPMARSIFVKILRQNALLGETKNKV